MANDKEIKVPIGYPLDVKPTDDKLKQDAARMCSEYINYWLPGEVEITVIIARPDSKDAAYATTSKRDRLLHLLDRVKESSVVQSLMIKGHRFQR